MTSSRNPNTTTRWSSALDLVRPAVVLLLLALLPVAALTSRAADRGEGERGASEVRHQNDRADSEGNPTRQA